MGNRQDAASDLHSVRAMREIDISELMCGTETPRTRAYAHGLGIELAVMDSMTRQRISERELAQRMGITKKELSKLFKNCLEWSLHDIARLEFALGMRLEIDVADEADAAR